MRAIALRLQGRAPLPLGAIALVLFLVFFAVLSGAAMALTGTLAVFVFGGIVIGAAALIVPLRWLVAGLFVMSLIVTGQIMYFGGISKANWIPFLIGLVLLVRYPIDAMQRNRALTAVVEETQWQVQVMKLCIGVFFATLFASTLINVAPPIQVLVTLKMYVFLWGVYLVLATGLVRPGLVERIWAWLPWLLPLQVPIILYQRFVVMSRTHAMASWDVVVGAFGGSQEGGGLSGAMAFYSLMGIFIAIFRYRAGLLPRWQTLMIILSGLLAIGMAEVKYMILLMPFCFVIAFARDILRNPVKGFMLVSAGFAVSIGIFIVYKAQFSNPIMTSTKEQYFESMFVGQTEASYVNALSRNQSRLGAIVDWSKQHSIREPVSLLIGHGLGSSQVTMTFIGEAQAAHFGRLDRSTLTILLWETGLLGTLAYLGMLGGAYLALRARSLEPHRTADELATSQSMAMTIVILAASLPYSTDLLGAHQIQLVMLTCVGYAAMRVSRRRSAKLVPVKANLRRSLV